MGRRELSNLSISDLTISILIAELVAISIENRNDNLLLTILPIILLVFLEIIFSYLELKIDNLKRVIDGKPSLIIKDGKLNIEEMIKHRFSLEDLLLSLRDKGITNINDVSFAILETNGKLSVFDNKNSYYPLPLIINGIVNKDALKFYNKKLSWLEDTLSDENVLKKDVLYAFYKDGKLYFIKK